MNDHPDRMIEAYEPTEPLIVPYGDAVAARNAVATL